MKMAVSSMLPVLVSFLGLIIASDICVAQVPVNPKMRSFSSAVKGGRLVANQELVLYESSTGEPGVITEQWFTGKLVHA
jgi:nitrogen fixation protein FixH